MIAIVRGLVSALVTIAAIVFALANRQTVSLAWSPVNDPVSLPLFAVGLGGLGLGFVAGAGLLWLRTLSLKWHARRQKRRIAALERDYQDLAAPRAAGVAQDRMRENQLLIEELGAP